MKRSSFIALIDIAAFVSFIFVVSTGVLMRYVLPTGSGHRLEILGLDRHEWGDIHFYITFIFLIILSIHLILHWKFILHVLHKGVKSSDIYRLSLGLVALIAVLALAAAPFIAPKEYSEVSKGYQFGKDRN